MQGGLFCFALFSGDDTQRREEIPTADKEAYQFCGF